MSKEREGGMFSRRVCACEHVVSAKIALQVKVITSIRHWQKKSTTVTDVKWPDSHEAKTDICIFLQGEQLITVAEAEENIPRRSAGDDMNLSQLRQSHQEVEEASDCARRS